MGPCRQTCSLGDQKGSSICTDWMGTGVSACAGGRWAPAIGVNVAVVAMISARANGRVIVLLSVPGWGRIVFASRSGKSDARGKQSRKPGAKRVAQPRIPVRAPKSGAALPAPHPAWAGGFRVRASFSLAAQEDEPRHAEDARTGGFGDAGKKDLDVPEIEGRVQHV